MSAPEIGRRARVIYSSLAVVLLCLYFSMAWLSWTSYQSSRKDYPKYATSTDPVEKLLARMCSPEEQRKSYWKTISRAVGGALMVPLVVTLVRGRGVLIDCYWSYCFSQSSAVFLIRWIPEGEPLTIIVSALATLLGVGDVIRHIYHRSARAPEPSA